MICAHCGVIAQDSIRTNVHLVLSRYRRQKGLIDGLSVDDFVVTDDGVKQKVHMDTSDTVLAPVSLVVLIQSSGISTPALARIVVGAIQPVTGGRGQAADRYDTDVRTFQEFTSDGGKDSRYVQHIEPRTISRRR